MNKLDQQIVNRILKVLNEFIKTNRYILTHHQSILEKVSIEKPSRSFGLYVEWWLNLYHSWIDNPTATTEPIPNEWKALSQEINALKQDFLTNGFINYE